MAKTKRGNLRKIFDKTVRGIEVVKTVKPKLPKRKSKGGCYIDPDLLAERVAAYQIRCETNKDDPCIIKQECERAAKSMCTGYCEKKIIKLDDALATMIWEMCKRIGSIRCYKTCKLGEDLPLIGYQMVIKKLRNMDREKISSAFSYITTVLKYYYMRCSKNENAYVAKKIKLEKDQK